MAAPTSSGIPEPDFVSKGSPSMASTSGGASGDTSFLNSPMMGGEPLGELDGAINNLAMSAKYNLTQLSFRQLLSDRWSKMQSWGSFMDTGKMLLPLSIQQWSKRLVQNFKHFQSNYLFVFVILFIYCILTSPLLLLVLAAFAAAGYIMTLKNAERPLKLFGRKLNLGQQYAILALIWLPLLYLVGAGGAVFWVIGASLFVIMLHASVYAIETLDGAGTAGQHRTPGIGEPFAFDVENV